MPLLIAPPTSPPSTPPSTPPPRRKRRRKRGETEEAKEEKEEEERKNDADIDSMTSKLTINDDTAGISAADEAVGVSTELLAMIAVVGALLCLCMLLGIVGCRWRASASV